jgi:DNA polymerase
VNQKDELARVAKEIEVCEKCELHFSRKKGVPGAGPADAEIMFIGEAPGFHENEQGLPFVGASGRFLDELLEQIGIKREDVFIGNVVKCRPPGNRDPQAVELEACSNYLERQIQIINPKVIVTLGRFSMARYFPNAKISQVHGQPKKVKGRLVIPMYHPAAALHQRSLHSVIESDFASLPDLIGRAEAVPDNQEDNQTENSPPQQLSMF